MLDRFLFELKLNFFPHVGGVGVCAVDNGLRLRFGVAATEAIEEPDTNHRQSDGNGGDNSARNWIYVHRGSPYGAIHVQTGNGAQALAREEAPDDATTSVAADLLTTRTEGLPTAPRNGSFRLALASLMLLPGRRWGRTHRKRVRRLPDPIRWFHADTENQVR